MKTFVEDMFRPDKLRPKKVNGRELKVRDFAELLKLYVKELRSGEYPTPERLFEATAKTANRAVVDSCYDKYHYLMTQLINRGPQQPEKFKEMHGDIITNILNVFKRSKKMGNETVVGAASRDLRKRIESVEAGFNERNSAAYEEEQNAKLMAALLGAAAVAAPVAAGAVIAAMKK